MVYLPEEAKLIQVAVSHEHADHVGGIVQFEQVYAPEIEIPVIESYTTEFMQRFLDSFIGFLKERDGTIGCFQVPEKVLSWEKSQSLFQFVMEIILIWLAHCDGIPLSGPFRRTSGMGGNLERCLSFGPEDVDCMIVVGKGVLNGSLEIRTEDEAGHENGRRNYATMGKTTLYFF